jgi:hypothetical protein
VGRTRTSDPLTTAGSPAAGDVPARMGRHEDLVTALLGAWLVAGLFVDGWAHNTRPSLGTLCRGSAT